MRRAVLALAILAVVVGAIYVGTAGLGAEQMFGYGVSNDSSRTVVVRFGSYGTFEVPPRGSGRAAWSFGYFHEDIEILDQQCRVLETVEPTTQFGSLWIRDDAPARLSEVDYDDVPTYSLESTQRCEG